MTIISGDNISLSTGGVLKSSSTGSPPDAPVLTGVVDGGDQDSAVASVTGTGTIQLYYRLKTDTDWTTGENRSGDGDITQTGLSAGSWYEFFCTDTGAGLTSAPSAVISVLIAATDNNIETVIYSLLTGDETITGLVSTKIYPNIIPQKVAMPAISFQQISGVRGHVLAGADTTVSARYQINCWSDSYAEARTISNAVRQELDGYRGTVNSRVVQSIQLVDEGDMPQISAGKDVLRQYGKRLDFIIFFKE